MKSADEEWMARITALVSVCITLITIQTVLFFSVIVAIVIVGAVHVF